jgi:hypothetical protein
MKTSRPVLLKFGLWIYTNKNYVKFTYDDSLATFSEFQKDKSLRMMTFDDSDPLYTEFKFSSRESLTSGELDSFKNYYKGEPYDLFNYIDIKLDNIYITETDYIKIVTKSVNLNGSTIYNLTESSTYNYNQFIVRDLDDYIFRHNDLSYNVLIPESSPHQLDAVGANISNETGYELYATGAQNPVMNYYNLNIGQVSTVSSTNDFVFDLKSKYENYQLGMIDVVNSLVIQLKGIFKTYGVELIRYPIDQNVHTVNHATYRISELQRQETHKTDDYPLRYCIRNHTTIDFELTTPDLVLLNDFKIKYQNLDVLTNFVEFYTKDSRGLEWISSLKWGPLPTDFEQDYSTDSQGNSAYKINFSTELEYYTVYNEEFNIIQSIIANLIATDANDKIDYNENIL